MEIQASSETSGRYQPAACKSRDGRLWFPTVKGLAVVDPKTLQFNEKPPPVLIEEVRANDELILGDYQNRHPAKPTPSGDEARPAVSKSGIRIAPGHARLLEIRYTATSLAAPEKARFKFRLEGHDPDWRSDDQNRRVAFYTNLRPGDYRFRVIACNNHGLWNDAGDSFAFQIAPHLYETGAFYASCAGALILLGLGSHRLRVRILDRIHRLEHQTAMDHERARIARDIHDDIGSHLSQLSVLGELAQRRLDAQSAAQPHLDKLRDTTGEIFQALDEIVWAVNPKQDSLAGLVSYLREFVPGLLGPAGIRCFLDFPSPVPDHPLRAEARHHLFLVVKEALQNILKHAHASEVRLRLAVRGRALDLAIEDNGCGYCLPADPPGSSRTSLANGLANMRHRLDQLGGEFHIESQPGHGTRILLRLPLE